MTSLWTALCPFLTCPPVIGQTCDTVFGWRSACLTVQAILPTVCQSFCRYIGLFVSLPKTGFTCINTHAQKHASSVVTYSALLSHCPTIALVMIIAYKVFIFFTNLGCSADLWCSSCVFMLFHHFLIIPFLHFLFVSTTKMALFWYLIISKVIIFFTNSGRSSNLGWSRCVFMLFHHFW